MLGAWLLSCAMLFALRLTFEPGLELGGLALMSALVAGCSYALFAVPVTALFSPRLQLRFASVLLLLSLAWSTLVLRVLFQEWPWDMLRHPRVGYFFPCWLGSFTLCAVVIYLFLLRRGARLDESRHGSPPEIGIKPEYPSS
jgi:hypothetical protein